MTRSEKPLPVEKLADLALQVAAATTPGQKGRLAWRAEALLGTVPESQHFDLIEAAKNKAAERAFEQEGKPPAGTAELVAIRNAQKYLDILAEISEQGLLVGQMAHSTAHFQQPPEKGRAHAFARAS